ncbi:MAG: nodulation protein NfeD [Deltaproteobacteria bacterium]|nr:nodulation protein NfeD [Deltaproteobacteria bacterium]
MKSGKILGIILALLVVLSWGAGRAAAKPGVVYTLTAAGSVNPGLADFINSGLEKAEKDRAEALIILLDTPGGLEASMRKICQAIINARVPVIVYVSPKGARAASAGVFITIAAHVAAMAPGTNIGAAHPVGIGLGKMDKTMTKKVVNDMVAFGRSLAKERGRNADWVEKAVRQSVSIDAEQAKKLKVIDFVARDLEEVLRKAHHLPVKLDATTVRLKTLGVPVKEIPEGLSTRILRHIADPNIAFILMMLGLAGLYFELAHPGVVLPGVVGVLSLLLAFYAFQTLPVNFIGLLLIVLAFIFFVLEIYVISYGLLSLGGIISLVLGSMMLFRGGGEAGMQIAWGVLIPTLLIISLFFLGIAALVVRSHLRRSRTGSEGLLGESGVAHTDLAPEGQVFVHGEYWRAVSEEPIRAGERIEVVQVSGLTLKVRRKT